jgi:hypothetical protein
MASVAVGISYIGTLDVKQGHLAQSYRGPSQPALASLRSPWIKLDVLMPLRH